MTLHLLIIGKNAEFRRQLAHHLRQEAFRVAESEDWPGTARVLGLGPVDAAVLSLKGLGRNGLELLKILRATVPGLPVITISGPGSVDLSIEAMRIGVFDDFLFPFEVDALVASIRNACGARRDPASGESAPAEPDKP